MKKILLLSFCLLFLGNLTLAEINETENVLPPKQVYDKARVVSAQEMEVEDPSQPMTQFVELKMLSGKFKGNIVEAEHMTSSMMGDQMVVKPGDKVLVFVDDDPSLAESPDGKPMFYIADYYRISPLIWLAVFYALLLLAIGGVKGFKSLISLVLTIGLLFIVLFPLTLKGWNPLLVSVVLAGVVSFLVFWIIGGRTIKSTSAAIGTLAGVAIAGMLALLAGNLMHLTGMSSEESRILLYSMNLNIDYRGLLFGSILIGALGAVMDIGMSIASAVEEVHRIHPEKTFKNLFDSGMNIGRDVMGTMSNTLILAYTGSSLPLLLLLVANQTSFDKIFNMELIAAEVVRALAGSIGLVLCIPITAFVSAYLNNRKLIKGE
ncbi:MAG: YibE/F family protein [Candidatus Margulisbacteria bacterium]|nr:YibE/F family protein [Candidatus Margulisiibacteriota bacterium]